MKNKEWFWDDEEIVSFFEQWTDDSLVNALIKTDPSKIKNEEIRIVKLQIERSTN